MIVALLFLGHPVRMLHTVYIKRVYDHFVHWQRHNFFLEAKSLPALT